MKRTEPTYAIFINGEFYRIMSQPESVGFVRSYNGYSNQVAKRKRVPKKPLAELAAKL